MHIDVNFAAATTVRPYALAFHPETDVDLLWQCLLSGQMDDASLDREMAANSRFRDHVLSMEKAGIRF